MTDLRIAIVGGGIGGLSAAVALQAAGARVRVYEQAPELGEVGAGVALGPNGLRLLRRGRDRGRADQLQPRNQTALWTGAVGRGDAVR